MADNTVNKNGKDDGSGDDACLDFLASIIFVLEDEVPDFFLNDIWEKVAARRGISVATVK